MDEAVGFDKKQYGLLAVRCETWGGFVFVNFDPAAPPLLAVLGELPALMRNYRMDEHGLHAPPELRGRLQLEGVRRERDGGVPHPHRPQVPVHRAGAAGVVDRGGDSRSLRGALHRDEGQPGAPGRRGVPAHRRPFAEGADRVVHPLRLPVAGLPHLAGHHVLRHRRAEGAGALDDPDGELLPGVHRRAARLRGAGQALLQPHQHHAAPGQQRLRVAAARHPGDRGAAGTLLDARAARPPHRELRPRPGDRSGVPSPPRADRWGCGAGGSCRRTSCGRGPEGREETRR